MTEGMWSDGVKTPPIDWRMSAALEDVPRGSIDVAEVTSLEGAVRAWRELDARHQAAAVLRPEHPVLIDGAAHAHFTADGIAMLAEMLPGS